MKRIAVALVGAFLGVNAYAGFMYQSELTVSGYTGETALSGFPILVRISAAKIPGFDYTKCRADGLDLQFTSPDGQTVYPHEIEKWDPVGGESLVWVRLPELSGADTKLLFNFGDENYVTPADATGVWASSAGGYYAGVWHYGENTTDGNMAAADSAKHDPSTVNMDAVPKYYNTLTTLPGKVGNGRQVGNNALPTSLIVPSYDAFKIGGTFSFSLWMKTPALSLNYPIPFGRSTDSWGADNAWGGLFWASFKSVRVYQGPNKGGANATLPVGINEDWVHFTYVVDGLNYSYYANGSKIASGTLTAAVEDNGSPLGLGGNPNGSGGIIWHFDETRLLSAAVSDDWVAANYATQTSDSFVIAKQAKVVGKDLLIVSGFPESFGDVSPAYGAHAVSARTPVACTASSEDTVISDQLHISIVAWKLYEYDADGNRGAEPINSGDGTSFTYNHVDGKTRELVWQLAYKRPLDVSSSRDVTVKINGSDAELGVNWVPVGATTVEVTPVAGVEGTDWSFRTWSGDTGDATTLDTQTLSFTLDAPAAVKANYVSRFRVSASGDDETGDGTPGKPWATIGKALSWCGDYDEVYVGGGTYTENLQLKDVSHFKILGGHDANWSRNLGSVSTVIVAADAAKPVLRLDNCTYGVVGGLTLKGGLYGLRVANTMGHRFEQLSLVDNVKSGLWYGADGTTELAGAPFALVSSIVAGNGEYGFEERATDWDFKQRLHVLNCTIVDNGKGGLRSQLQNVYLRNSIVANNSPCNVDKNMQYDYYGCLYLYNSCLYREGGNDFSIDLKTDSLDRILSWRGGNLRCDPRLGADFRLGSASRCLKRGADLSAYDPFPVLEDRYGNAWSGAYDMGAVRSSSPIVKGATYADVYVSPDGDDGNEGNVATAPVKTVREGLLRTAPGGTCHLAAGNYGEVVLVEKPGVALVGAGRETTHVGVGVTWEPALVVAASGASVCGVSNKGGLIGLWIENDSVVNGMSARDCDFSGNRIGVFSGVGNDAAAISSTRSFSRIAITNNTDVGFWHVGDSKMTILADALLVANNGYLTPVETGMDAARHSRGMYVQTLTAYLYNCTFLDNSKASVTAYPAWGNHVNVTSYNSAFQGSVDGWQIPNGGRFAGLNNQIDCTGAAITLQDMTYLDGRTNTFVFADARLTTSGRFLGRPLDGSPLPNGGVNINGTDAARVEVAKDLLGNPYRPRHWDIGCYAQPLPGLMLLVK